MEGAIQPPADPGFRLIETLGFRPGQGVIRQDRHLARMARSAEVLGLSFDRAGLSADLGQIAEKAGNAALRIRVTLDVAGNTEVTTGPLADNPPFWRLAVSETVLNATDIWLRHKTTQRQAYETARRSMPAGVDELLFLNDRGELCEGTITNLFLETKGGQRLTPAESSGLLPGILREEMLATGQVSEAVLTLEDLHQAPRLWVGNSLRGMIRAELATP